MYTDGSDISEGVGVAIVLFKSSRPIHRKVLMYHLGPSSKHTVYEAEVIGILLGIELIRQECQPTRASIAANNQVVIRALVRRE